MRKGLMFVLVSLCLIMTGCGQQKAIKTKNVQNTASNMANNESFQKAFSDGRIHVIERSPQTKQAILQNTVREQKMMMEDADLSEKFLALNINMNRMMTASPPGQEQLMRSTLTLMDGITKDAGKLRSFVQIQNDSRKKAIKDEKLLNQILLQNVQEQYLALSHPAASGRMKDISLKTTGAILNDNTLKPTLLQQNVQAFTDISASPSLRSQMAGAMLPLLKDPKIAAELEKMIKLAVAKETQTLQAKLQQLQKAQRPEIPAEGSKKPSHNPHKMHRSVTEPDDGERPSRKGPQQSEEPAVDR